MPNTISPDFKAVSLDELSSNNHSNENISLWGNLLSSGEVALLTGLWKLGKTTLVTGLVRALADGTLFLGRQTTPTTVWIVSEESQEFWRQRVQTKPIGSHVQLLSRPFLGQPTVEQWRGLIAAACTACQQGQCGLLVIDPLTCFVPGAAENDSILLLDMLRLLVQFTSLGGVVVLLHHPRKSSSAKGCVPRGSSALPDFVDVSMTLTNFGKEPVHKYARRLTVQTRRNSKPDELVYSWCPQTSDFSLCDESFPAALERCWIHLKSVLERVGREISVVAIRSEWPEEATLPGKTWLYVLLKTAEQHQRIVRTGRGTRHEPYLYRLHGI